MGDKNTSFFHKYASQRRRINRIQGLQKADGSIATTENEMEEIARVYFSTLFESKGVGDMEHILSGINVCISDSMNQLMQNSFTEEDIIEAVNGMGPTKASGYDGFPAIFYQKFWHIVGKDTTEFCLNVLNHGHSVEDINRTLIVLIPKTVAPTNLKNFCPISLCTVLYKIIAKAVANQLQKVLDVCIDASQSAFVPSRLITDNVLLAYEVLHTLKNKRTGRKGYMALKLDMNKAYDRVECSVQYSILSNGDEGLSFRATRGLRQGDPLSPYLFLFCGEGLLALMRLANQEKRIKGAKVSREAPSITHLMFADDCILFGDVSNRGINVLKEILREYEACSGQCVNFEKTTVFFSANVTDQERNVVCQTFNVQCSNDPNKYLGLPSMVGRKRKLAFQGLKDRLKQRINGWSIRHISQGGREVFIKAVLQAIPIIGDGQKVSIWDDRWVPGVEILNCQNSSQNPRLVKVAELIDNNTRSWNAELILSTFAEREAAIILSIPLSISPHEDFIIWSEEATGEYSVRSGHRVLTKGRHTQIQESLKKFYKSLWNLEIPSKLKITAWRGMCNYLPNFSNLHFRRIMGPSNCRRCQAEPETREHLFRNCPVAKQTWEKLGIGWSVLEESMEFTAWVKAVFENNSLLGCRTFICALWGLWSSRNKFLHEGEHQTGGQIADFITNYLKEIDGSKKLLPARGIQATRWKAPGSTCMRINFDATFNYQNREACSGLVVRNGSAELDLREVEIEGDSRTVIRKIQEKEEDRSEIFAYIEDAKRRSSLFRSCHFLFIKREANMVAHLIATEGFKKGENAYLFHGVPPIAVQAVVIDGLGWKMGRWMACHQNGDERENWFPICNLGRSWGKGRENG
ncbi:reverse transcriptase [Gossypium australe]|uniref:Reverse transcriptase n=1 Tax=Gossypium australe TaxID=47621 RepID=A0A5B6UJR2_9ROSI|nr:reverse transcriptase [Gossypium australe]